MYEIAKELGKESKEIVARAKELGIEVKSHASSVESEIATRITASFSQAAVPKKETTQKPTQSLPKEQPSALTAVKETTEAEKKAEPKAVAPKQKSEVEMKSAPAKPKSRNFKAEREARAKEQAERRNKQQDNRPQKQQNGDKRNRDERNQRNNRIKIAMTEEIATNNATTAIIETKTIVVKNKIVQILQIRIALKQIKDHALISRRVQRL